ncbi:MAG TPA: DUF1707 domain-containing protein [Propionicimonas sp.]|jgi:hypothetical protein|uniref:DUF1707 SHOCT-like domain-containing protein n=1 Tax=Propionicimonas sp. TaxID=1955623 RepID=UPI002F3E21E2
MTDLGHLRIGTTDRRDAVARIDRAAAEGRLTPQEASDRAARVETAVTYGDLDPLIADLPALAPPALPAGWSAANRLPIAGGMSREKRDGRWEIPPYLRVSGDLGSVRLDCREAVCLAPVIDIEVSAGAGGIKIIVPDGWGVDSDLVAKGWGSVRNTANRHADPGQPQLVLHGSAGLGRLRVRTATRRRGRELRRRARLELAGGPTPASGWVQEHSEMPNADDLR